VQLGGQQVPLDRIAECMTSRTTLVAVAVQQRSANSGTVSLIADDSDTLKSRVEREGRKQPADLSRCKSRRSALALSAPAAHSTRQKRVFLRRDVVTSQVPLTSSA
jgi:hypothetical protein